MTNAFAERLPQLLEVLGLTEEPMGIFFSDRIPAEGLSPSPLSLPSREKEIRNEIDWPGIFSHFSCMIGDIWRARKKHTAAWFDAEHFGCPGGAFWLGFMKPQTETIVHYVSTGIPGAMPGERYCDSPDHLRDIFNRIDPEPAPKPVCILKPVGSFTEDEVPVLVAFFARPETLCGLHQLAAFVTNDPEIVASPWGAACTNLVTWPMKYLIRGTPRAVLGGWDPSARRFFKTDELTFTVPFSMFTEMLQRWDQSFLTTQTWAVVQKKIHRSRKAWNEDK